MSLTANVQNGIPFTKLRKNPLQTKTNQQPHPKQFEKQSTQHDDTNVQRHYIVEHDLQK